MLNQQTKVDLTKLHKAEQAYLQQCIADSQALRAHLADDSVAPWKAFFHLGQAFITYMQDETFATSLTREAEAADLIIIWRKLGFLYEHLGDNPLQK